MPQNVANIDQTEKKKKTHRMFLFIKSSATKNRSRRQQSPPAPAKPPRSQNCCESPPTFVHPPPSQQQPPPNLIPQNSIPQTEWVPKLHLNLTANDGRSKQLLVSLQKQHKKLLERPDSSGLLSLTWICWTMCTTFTHSHKLASTCSFSKVGGP